MEVLTTLGVKPIQLVVQILGFLVLFVCLAKFLWKPVLGLMQAREKEVSDMLDRADEARRKSAELEAEYKTRMAKIDEEAQQHMAEELRKGHEMAERIVQDARKQADFEKQKALNAIQEEARKARMELRDYAVGLSMDIADKVLHEKIDRKAHEGLVKRFLSELDPLN